MAAARGRGFIKSFNTRPYGERSFNERYSFINENAKKEGVEIMTIEDLITLIAGSYDFNQKALEELRKLPSTRNRNDLISSIERYGIMGKAARLIGISGTACVDPNNIDQRKKDEILLFARELWGDNWARRLGVNPNNMNEVCEKYKEIIANPRQYGIENPGSSIDFLRDDLFQKVFKDFLYDKFISLCMRGGQKNIGDDYIKSIVDNAISDMVYYDKEIDRSHLVIVTVEATYPYTIFSFIGAEKGHDDDVHGELICSKEGGKSGIGKLQMAATLLCAKDAGVQFVFIQAIAGLFGVQHALYSRFGFETDFPEPIRNRKDAVEQCMFKPLSELIGDNMFTNFIDQCRINYIKRPNIINWLTSMPSRIVESFSLTPMWIYAPLINPECIKNLIENPGWDCRIGEIDIEHGMIGGEGARETIDSRSWLGKLAKVDFLRSFFQPRSQYNAIKGGFLNTPEPRFEPPAEAAKAQKTPRRK